MGKLKEKVLILDAQAVQTLIIAESLVKKGYIIDLFCDSKISYGYNTKFRNKRQLVPNIKDEVNYLQVLKDYIKREKIDVILPMTDESAIFVSKNKNELSLLCKFIMPSWDVFQKAYDKNLLMNLCFEKGYPHPLSIDLSKISYKTIDSTLMNYPALIKPNYTTGGRGMTLVNNLDELISVYPRIYKEYGNCHLQEFINAGWRQLKVQVFIDSKSQKIYSSVIHKQRYYPENGGSSCCNETIYEDNVVEICISVLKDIGWEGFADFDLIEDPKDGVLKIMEINPRIPACIKSAIKSGIDYGNLIVDASLGKDLKEYCYNPGKKLRHIGFDFLWFIYSKNRFKTKPSWFNFFSKGLSFQDFSIKDPKPFFFGTYGNFKKQINPSFRKEKSGLR